MSLIISPNVTPLFTSTTDGSVAASGGGTTNFLRADGTWASPASGSFLSASTTSTQDGYFTGVNFLEGGTTPTFYTRLLLGSDLTVSRTVTFALGDFDRTITFPLVASSVTLATIANLGQTFAGNTTFSNATVTVGTSTAASTYGLGTGATIAGATKAINIGTSGVATSVTNLTIGSIDSTNTTTIYGGISQSYDVPQLGAPFSGVTQYFEPQAGITLSSVTLNVSTAVFSYIGTTTLTVGQVIRLTGTNTGALITSYVSGTNYYVISATGSPTTSFTLSASLGGPSIAATGTTGTTGLTYTTAAGATAFGTGSPYITAQTFFGLGVIPYLLLNSGTNTSSYVAVQTANSAYSFTFSNAGVFTAPNITAGSTQINNGNQANTAWLATGTASASTYLRGDGTWATVTGGSGLSHADTMSRISIGF
jgi:hypothetical protein